MSLTSSLLTGIAQLIDDAGIGVYDPAKQWLSTDTGVAVFIGQKPQDPPHLISLNDYAVADDPHVNDATIGVQVWLRGTENPIELKDRNDAIRDLLNGIHDTTINGVPVVLITRNSSLPMPADGNRRLEHASNFYVHVAWATQYCTD